MAAFVVLDDAILSRQASAGPGQPAITSDAKGGLYRSVTVSILRRHLDLLRSKAVGADTTANAILRVQEQVKSPVPDWPAYRQVDWVSAAAEMRGRLVIDARSVLEAGCLARYGLTYEDFGRARHSTVANPYMWIRRSAHVPAQLSAVTSEQPEVGG